MSTNLDEYNPRYEAKLIKMILKQKPDGNGKKIKLNMDFGDVEVEMVQSTN